MPTWYCTDAYVCCDCSSDRRRPMNSDAGVSVMPPDTMVTFAPFPIVDAT